MSGHAGTEVSQIRILASCIVRLYLLCIVLSGMVKSFTAEGGENGPGMFARLFQQSKYLLSVNLVYVPET
jgi:hypothetical protein